MTIQFWKNVSALIILASLALFTTQCQTEIAGVDNSELTDELTDLRSEAAVLSPQQGNCECITNNYPFEELSAEEVNALLLMVEEEKMARDIYLELSQLWDHRVFTNIAKAENRHMNSLICLLQKYDIPDPIGENENGVFTNEELQNLYNILLDQGSQSIGEAFLVGATIEDVDIYDLMQLSEETNNEDILAVFNELTKGSRNHLRAFTKQISLLETTYSAQNISEDLLNEIISTPRERGGSLCFTQGNGNGGNGNNGDCPNGGNGNGGNGNNGDCPNGGNGNGGNGNNGDCPNGGNGSGGNGSGGNGNGGNGNGGNGNGGNGNGGNG